MIGHDAEYHRECHSCADSSGPSAREEGADRRLATRFPMDLQVRYKIAGRNTVELGSGRTINMASGGILFTTERTFAPGERVEVAVNWPAQLDNKCPLKLVISGHVVRSESTRAAVVIDRYEFRDARIARDGLASFHRRGSENAENTIWFLLCLRPREI